MHGCCAVEVIAGLTVIAIEADGEVGVSEHVDFVCRETGRLLGNPVPIAPMTRNGQGDSAVPFYLRVF
jgi:hypothetical protein